MHAVQIGCNDCRFRGGRNGRPATKRAQPRRMRGFEVRIKPTNDPLMAHRRDRPYIQWVLC